MMNELHVVLGASGSVGASVVEELKSRNLKIRAVERRKQIKGIETINADMADLGQTIAAIEGASHVYLCIGLPYDAAIWQEKWPKIISNVINACEKANAKLIFLDNIYMYGPAPLSVPFDEKHTRIPVSKKGKVRKDIAEVVLKAHAAGRIKAVIGRSADFYGPNARNSILYISFLERMLAGKGPQSLSKTDIKHTYAYTVDNGRALVALALDESTYGQEWHMPVSRPITIDESVEVMNKVMKTSYKASVIPRPILKLMGLFIPTIKEVNEMLYQSDAPYIMSDDKFRKHFPDFKVTEFETGIREMIASFKP